ncbi:hypothetical protein SNEBB_006613 [Seison nebaliae]|nr:hypothetical protein SNEBB_006613 [Seison nebaliae]
MGDTKEVNYVIWRENGQETTHLTICLYIQLEDECEKDMMENVRPMWTLCYVEYTEPNEKGCDNKKHQVVWSDSFRDISPTRQGRKTTFH